MTASTTVWDFTGARCVDSRLPFTTDEADPSELRAALDLCQGCPVLAACRAWAEQQDRFDGVAGGSVWRRGRRVTLPAQQRPILVDDVSLRRYHSRFNSGHRDLDTVEGERAYQAVKYQRLKARARAAASPDQGSSPEPPDRCADCAQPLRPQRSAPDGRAGHKGRGLCHACYDRHASAGDLADFERRSRPRDELLEDYQLLVSEGYGRAHIANRLGLTEAALIKALQRAHATTSPRRTQ